MCGKHSCFSETWLGENESLYVLQFPWSLLALGPGDLFVFVTFWPPSILIRATEDTWCPSLDSVFCPCAVLCISRACGLFLSILLKCCGHSAGIHFLSVPFCFCGCKVELSHAIWIRTQVHEVFEVLAVVLWFVKYQGGYFSVTELRPRWNPQHSEPTRRCLVSTPDASGTKELDPPKTKSSMGKLKGSTVLILGQLLPAG